MDKNEQIRQVEDELDCFVAVVEKLRGAELTDRALDEWSVREILSHITGWTRIDIDILRRLARNERPLPEGEEYGTAESRNPGFAADAQNKSPDELLGELRGAFAEFIAAAEALPEERFEDGRTAHRILRESAYAHLAEHRTEIESYARSLRA